jgi:hypothetical protein
MTPETISITVALISVLMVAINKIGLYFYDPTSRKSDVLPSSGLDTSKSNTNKAAKGSITYVSSNAAEINLPPRNTRGRVVRITITDGKGRKVKSRSIIQKAGDFPEENPLENPKKPSES